MRYCFDEECKFFKWEGYSLYRSITESLQELLRNPGFSLKCEAWRKRSTKEGYYCDVYDGQIWKDFQNLDGIRFLSVPNNFDFQINVDWFNPFTHTQHSEGAIYLSVMNLPRQERFLVSYKRTFLRSLVQ